MWQGSAALFGASVMDSISIDFSGKTAIISHDLLNKRTKVRKL